MTNILLLILIALCLVNLWVMIQRKPAADIVSRLSEMEVSVLKMSLILDRTEDTLKEEFQRNRKEFKEISKVNREELAGMLKRSNEQFSKNVKDLNAHFSQS